jgi:hypothetical protein
MTKDFFGKKFLIGGEGYTGTDAADPTEQVRWEVWAPRAAVTNNDVLNVMAFVTIEYDVVFTEPQTLKAS